MRDELYRELRSLKEAMDSDPRYIALLSAEKEMEGDIEAKAASEEYKKLQESVGAAPSDSEEQKALLKELSDSKARLYEIPVVKKYLEALKTWNDVLKEISLGVFGEYAKKEPF